MAINSGIDTNFDMYNDFKQNFTLQNFSAAAIRDNHEEDRFCNRFNTGDWSDVRIYKIWWKF